MKKCLSIFVLLFGTLAVNSCKDDFDDNLRVVGQEMVITPDSELFDVLMRVVTDEDDPSERITCIDFIYPFQLIIYNENLQPVETRIVTGDSDFSQLLAGILDSQAISISYPIATTLIDGTEFSINNNSELKLAIDSCSKEDIIQFFNSLFSNPAGESAKCYWEVGYEVGANNTYVGGVFEANANGTLTFSFNNLTYLVTWTFLYVNDTELHMNISLEGTSQVALDWSIDRKIELLDGSIKIINQPKNYILQRACEETVVYAIGDIGPSGGIVFYDKGSYSKGWRYMEAAASDLGTFEWGCLGTSLQTGTNTAVGTGLYNTGTIVNYHDNLASFYTNPAICNPSNNGTVAAQKALLNITGTFKDWFLPSTEELLLMHQNLHLQSLGSFTNEPYWSSSETDATKAKTIDFSNGALIEMTKVPAVAVRTRAIRYF